METLLEQLGDKIVYVIIGVCFLVAILTKCITTIVTHNAREKSRREIAAYIAEGSMTPEHGERLLRANVSGKTAEEE